MDKNQAGDQLGSCENNVSMFELFENHPDKETVEETHQTLSKNFIPGETFADIVNIIAQNNLMNAFVLSINKDDEIRLSSGFAMIKSGKGICLPKVMFTNFYPGRMEKPMLEKLPSEKESQLEGTTTKLPELAKIVECEDVDEIKDLFTNEALLATTMRNFVVLSPKLASSMASSGTESSRVEMLIKVVKELKDIKIGVTNEVKECHAETDQGSPKISLRTSDERGQRKDKVTNSDRIQEEQSKRTKTISQRSQNYNAEDGRDRIARTEQQQQQQDERTRRSERR